MADIGAMASVLALIARPDRWHLYPLGIGMVSFMALALLSYKTYSSLLKWLSLCVFSYVGVTFFVHVPWATIIHDTFLPRIVPQDGYLAILTAVMGTTISPYLFIWQSSLEVEAQNHDPNEKPLRDAPHQAFRQFANIRIDTYIGMALSCVVMYFIILATASTLHLQNIIHIDSAEQAARALEPIAGHFAFVLFAVGILGSGLLAIPTLAGSLGYAAGEAFNWPTGISYEPRKAIRFYTIIGASILIGTALNFLGMNPIRFLIGSAIINGLISVPMLFALMLIAGNRKVMGKFAVPRMLTILGWLTTALMVSAAVLAVARVMLGMQS